MLIFLVQRLHMKGLLPKINSKCLDLSTLDRSCEVNLAVFRKRGEDITGSSQGNNLLKRAV